MPVVAWPGIPVHGAWAQDSSKEPPKLGWSNNADLSLVLTAGNSATETWGLSDKLRRVWADARFEFNVDLVHSNTSDDRFFPIAPGLEFPVSLQWLYEHEPALESDLDVVAFVEVVNPDGIPGSGDERFRTLSSGGAKLIVGSANARKDKLDTIFRTALVIAF